MGTCLNPGNSSFASALTQIYIEDKPDQRGQRNPKYRKNPTCMLPQSSAG